MPNTPMDMTLPASKPERGSILHPTSWFQAGRRLLGTAVVRKGVLSLSSQGVTSAVSFATAAVIGNHSKEALGVFALATTVVLVLRGVQGELVASPFTVYSQRRSGRDLALFSGSVFVHEAVVALAGALVLSIILLCVRLAQGPANLATVLGVLVFVVPFIMVRCFLRHYLFAQLRFGKALLLDVLVGFLQIESLLALAYFDAVTAPNVYAAIGFVSVVGCVAWWVGETAPLHFVRERWLEDWRQNWRFSRWALLSQLLGSSIPYVAPWFLWFAHGEGVTGLFSACSVLVGVAHMFVAGLANLLTPKARAAYLEHGTVGLKRILIVIATMMSGGLLVFLVLIGLAGGWILVRVFGAEFAGLGLPCFILTVGALANAISVVAGNGLWAIDRPRANLLADVCMLSTTVVTTACLVWSHQVLGAAIAVLSGCAVGALVRSVTLFRLLRRES